MVFRVKEGEYRVFTRVQRTINEILWLQRKHHHIIESDKEPTITTASLAELHKLNITLSNYFDVAPSIGITTISEPAKPEINAATRRKTLSSSLHILI